MQPCRTDPAAESPAPSHREEADYSVFRGRKLKGGVENETNQSVAVDRLTVSRLGKTILPGLRRRAWGSPTRPSGTHKCNGLKAKETSLSTMQGTRLSKAAAVAGQYCSNSRNLECII